MTLFTADGLPYEHPKNDEPGHTLKAGSPHIAMVETQRVIDELRAEIDELRYNRPGWTPIADATRYTGGAFVIDVTAGGLYPAGTFRMLRLYGHGDLDAAGYVHVRINSDTTTGLHRTSLLGYDGNDATDIAFHATQQGFVVAHWATVASNTFELTMTETHLNTTIGYTGMAARMSDSATTHDTQITSGSLVASRSVDSLQVFARTVAESSGGASNTFGNIGISWTLEGYRGV